MPGEVPEIAPEAPLKHYRDRATNEPLCGASRGESGFARGWKKVTCEGCFRSKRDPGRPKLDDTPTTIKTKSEPTPEIDEALGKEISILLSAFVITPACIQAKKAPPPVEMVAQVGPAVVDVLDHYGYKEQMDHPGIKLAVTAAAIAFANYRAPVIEDERELLKAHGIDIDQNPA
jgi:hypothetical protein